MVCGPRLPRGGGTSVGSRTMLTAWTAPFSTCGACAAACCRYAMRSRRSRSSGRLKGIMVPGPLLRVRVGDSVELTLANDASSAVDHSVDLHAVTGPHGGAADLQVPPGQRKTVTFKLLTPGLFVYHCATPMVAQHMASGMYGMILVEPEEGLPPVAREFYVMQGEIYTEAAYGAKGRQTASVEKLLNERPDYFVFNGAVGALTKEHPLRARVGETMRI